MKSALAAVLVLVAVVAGVSADGWPGFPRKRDAPQKDSVANINEYMDRVLNQTVEFLNKNNLEPYKLEDRYIYNFTFKDLLGITWHTRLGLFDGLAKDLTTIHRNSDSQLSYTSDARTLVLEANVIFDHVEIDYDYYAETINIGPKGVFTAKLKDLTANLVVSVELRTFNATLQSFKLQQARSIKVDVTGLTLFGNLAVEAFANVFTFFLQGPILAAVEGKVLSAIADSVNSVNAGSILIVAS